MKDPRAKFKHNLLFRLFFCWLEPLFCIGCRSNLNHSDLYAHPSESDSRYLFEKFSKYWSYEKCRSNKAPRLLWVFVKCFWPKGLLLQFMNICIVCIFIAQSEVLGQLIDYFSIEDPSTRETTIAYLLASFLCLLGIMGLLMYLSFFLGRKLGGTIRIILTSAIYTKVFSLSQKTLSEVTMGHVINIASNDVHRFDEGFLYLPFVLSCLFHLLAVTYLLYGSLEWSAILMAGLVILSVPLLLASSLAYSKIRFKTAKVTDKRVKVMNEVISGIRVIKMYGWEYAFSKVVSTIRKRETWLIMIGAILRGFNQMIGHRINTIIICVVFSVFVSTGGELSPGVVFSTISHVAFLSYTTVYALNGILFSFDARVAYKRIRAFLLLPELHVYQEITEANEEYISLTTKRSSIGITVQNLTASWYMDINRPALHDISFTLDRNHSLVAVVGPVGSGKSTLLQCILRELLPLSGTVLVNGSIAFVSQDPVVFSATVRENILFGLPYEEEWYKSVIEGCALVKDFELLSDDDLTLVGERGVTLSGGQKARVNLARAVYRKADIYLLDDPLSAVDAQVSRHIFEKCICGLLSNKCVLLVTHQVQYLQQCDYIVKLTEDGAVDTDLSLMYNEKDDSSIYNEVNNADANKYDPIKIDEVTDDEGVACVFSALSNEERAHGTVSMKTYYRYFKAGGSLLSLLVFVLLVITEINIVITDWWLADWAQCSVQLNGSLCSFNTNSRIQVFAGLTTSVLVLSTFEFTLLSVLLVRASQVLHDKMFARVLRAPILFFDTNPIGRILNRFSKDIGFMDDILIIKYVIFIITLVRCLAVLLTTVVANYYLVPLFLILCVLFVSIRWYYLQTARNVKRLEALARSPIYSHLSLTFQGLATIRSYSMQSVMIDQLHNYQNQHTQAWYIFIASSRWLSMRLDCIIVLFTFVALISSVVLAGRLDQALVSLSLAYILSLTDVFSFVIRLSTDVENLMVSPERVIAYGALDIEPHLEASHSSQPAPSDWPKNGQIILKGVCYSHSKDGPAVLHDISCIIPPGHKVGIVGRTGAGKSSLIAALFRLATHNGSIIIDGIDTKSLGLHDLRKKLSIIPQDPVLFGGTVRYNLDPFGIYTDSEIWTALEQVQLKSPVEALCDKLEAPVNEGGSNFSVGQRQLFCLARALLRKNSILILDEATANVDLETDTIIQQVITQQFAGCTVLTIAHRLHTVMDYDWIMVMDKGHIVEYDKPNLLLSRSSSHLSQMVDQTGALTASKLRDIAMMRNS